MQELRWAAWAGAGAGLVLGIFFKIVQAASGVVVYTLLLTMDYVPVAKRFDWPEWASFAVHLAAAALAGWIWGGVCRRMAWRPPMVRVLSVLLGVFLGMLLLPTAVWSELTPHPITPAFALTWLAGHLLFGYTLGALLARRLQPQT